MLGAAVAPAPKCRRRVASGIAGGRCGNGGGGGGGGGNGAGTGGAGWMLASRGFPAGTHGLAHDLFFEVDGGNCGRLQWLAYEAWCRDDVVVKLLLPYLLLCRRKKTLR